MSLKDHKSIFKAVLFPLGLITAVFVLICIIIFSVALTPSSCLKHHDYPYGAGEYNYCVLATNDDDLKFYFDDKSENHKRYDSKLYILAPPFYTYRETRSISAQLKEDDYEAYHYMLKGDHISGVAKCSDECTVRVAAKTNDCLNLDYTLNSNGDSQVVRKRDVVKRYHHSTASDLIDLFFYLTECMTVEKELFEQEGTGTIPFDVECKDEYPVYVRVKNKKSTGYISYQLEQTRIDVSRPVTTCNNYTCSFGNLTGGDRTDPYIALNVFSENMTVPLEMKAKYFASKPQSITTSIGFGVTTAVLLVLTAIFAVLYFFAKKG